ncbi:2-keto-4-pentenoate hydratase [Actinomycetospora flava]|uniref:4-oxalocrotonate decarboxylase n=1 Tax=Actinomycetospora flava TaxID=3129232 RepID=A0ABU8LYI9_9PSEU
MTSPDAWAAWIDEAHLAGRLLDAPDELGPADAYAVQRALTARREARGARRIGWKLGYTSAVMRAQMGVDSPNLGPLLDTMVDPPPSSFVQPRVEPEIGIVVGADGRPAGARAVLEVVDSVWRDYRFTLATNTADGSSAAGVVVGGELDGDLAALTVELWRDGVHEATGTGEAAMGHPHRALDWLRDALADQGDALREGDLVITGGLTRAVELPPGGVVEARFPGTRVTVRG